MEISPVLALTIGGGFTVILMLSAVLIVLSERRARTARVRGAVGKRTNRNGPDQRSGSNEAWQKGGVAFMRSATNGISLIKGRHAKEAKMLLMSAGYRSRDAIVVYTFFKLVTPLIFVAGAALYVYGLNPIGKGPLIDAAAAAERARPAKPKQPEVVTAEQQQALDKLEKVDFGTWFEFKRPEDLADKLKLAWFSRVSSRYMFVDHAGVKQAVETRIELAKGMAQGLIKIIELEKKSFMERALEAVFSRLKSASSN